MITLNDINERPIALVLGCFDSLHFGHRRVIAKAKEYAKFNDCATVVSTFSNDAAAFLGDEKKQVYTFQEKEHILKKLGVDAILDFEMNDDFKCTNWQTFLNGIISKYNIKYIACGYDYTFGADREGDVEKLKWFCLSNGIDLGICDEVSMFRERVSTTQIKDRIIVGDVSSASQLLCGSYFMLAPLKREGESNVYSIEYPCDKLMPKLGKYRCMLYAENFRSQCIAYLNDDKIYICLKNIANDISDKIGRLEFYQRIFANDEEMQCSE